MKGFLDNLIQNVGGSIAGALQMGVNRLGRGDTRVGGNGMGGASGVFQPKVGKAYATDERGLTIPNEMLPGNQELLNPLASPNTVTQPEQVLGASSKGEYQPQSLDEIKAMIDSGFQKFNGGKSPVATLSGELAQTGKRLSDSTQGKIDPLMAAVVALKESRGGLDQKPKANANYWNIMKPGVGLANYGGDPARAISSPDPNETLNFEGLLRNGAGYQAFRNSGNLADFFSKFTPASDPLNPGVDEQVSQYNKLRALFN